MAHRQSDAIDHAERVENRDPKLSLDNYQAWVASRAIVTQMTPMDTVEARRQLLSAIGIAGEGSEVLDLIKKSVFHGKPLDRDKLRHELGDVFWYFTLALEAFGFTLNEIVSANVDKLNARDGVNQEKWANRAKV